MAERAILTSDQIGVDAGRAIDARYAGVLDPVLSAHRHTLERIAQYAQQGRKGMARALWRSSGLASDLANAIATAGKDSTREIMAQRSAIIEVMADDDGW